VPGAAGAAEAVAHGAGRLRLELARRAHREDLADAVGILRQRGDLPLAIAAERRSEVDDAVDAEVEHAVGAEVEHLGGAARFLREDGDGRHARRRRERRE